MIKRKSIPGSKNRFIMAIKNRIFAFELTQDFISRMRWVLFVSAFLLLYIAFQVGDDWFVREFANYDWARSIGF
jgi:hypothetical protein